MPKRHLDEINAESLIHCFSETIDEKGGISSSGTIALIVPPFAVPKSTQFSCHMLPETTLTPSLNLPENHYLMSPILSLSPHDAMFQRKVAIRFPFSAVPKGWFLRLTFCPLNGDRWQSLLDVLVPQDMSSSSLVVISHDGTLYDPDVNSILVDHFCRKCWVGVPIRPDVKKRIWCSLFGRPLGFGGPWEIIVRCFDPYMEVYQRVAALMQTYGAEPLIEGPESLDIGNRGVVRIALQTGQLPWRLEGGPQEFITPAKSTFWEGTSESFQGYRCSFIVRPEKEADYLRVGVLVSYIDGSEKQSRSKQMMGTAPLLGCYLQRRTIASSVEPHYIYNLRRCSNFAIGPNNQVVDKRSMVSDTAGQLLEKENDDGNSLRAVSRTTASSLRTVPECGQQV